MTTITPKQAAEAAAITEAARFWIGRSDAGRMIFDREPNPADYPGMTIAEYQCTEVSAAPSAAAPAPVAAITDALRRALALCDHLIHQKGERARAMACDLRPLVEAAALAAVPAAAPIVQPVGDDRAMILREIKGIATSTKRGVGARIADIIDLIGKFEKRAPASSTVEAKDAVAIRAAAMEEAAQICEGRHYGWKWDDEPDSDSGPRDCARSIRAAIASSAGEVKP